MRKFLLFFLCAVFFAPASAQQAPEVLFTCPLDTRFASFPSLPAPQAGDVQPTLREFEVATDEDLEFVTRSGGATASGLLVRAAMETVDVVYIRDLSLHVRHVFRNSWTTPDPYQGTTSDAILIAFQEYWNANFGHVPRDTAHLFTGKLSNLGLAYVGTVCRSPLNAYGLSAKAFSPDIQAKILAHELGHNLGGNHQPTGIMQAVVTTTTEFRFSEASQAEIRAYVENFGSCLAPILTAGEVEISGKVTDAKGRPLKDVSLAFFAPDGLFRASTNAFGFYRIVLPTGDYVAFASDRRGHVFQPRAVSVKDSLSGFDFVAE